MKRYRFDNAVKGRRFARKTDGNVWDVTYQRSTPSSRRAVEEHNYNAKHFRTHVCEYRNLRRLEADAKKRMKRLRLRGGAIDWLERERINRDMSQWQFERYVAGVRKGTIL